MRKKIKKTFVLVAALSCLCAPIALTIVGLWMIYNVDLWIGLVLSAVGCSASVWEYGYLHMWYNSRKSKKKTK